jgi:two-component system LytT family response regulator
MLTRVLVLGQHSAATQGYLMSLPPRFDCQVAFEAPDLRSARMALEEGSTEIAVVQADFRDSDPGAGFGLLAALPVSRRPLALVFVSSHEEDAVRAFELEATDFLFEPMSRGRFEAAIVRARQTVLRQALLQSGDELQRLVAATRAEEHGVTPAPGPATSSPSGPACVAERIDGGAIRVREGGRTRWVPVADIDWFEADGNYIVVNAGGSRFRTRGTLAALEARLDPRQFVRIHRRVVVNMDRVRELSPLPGGDGLLTLGGGATLRLSRTYRTRVR